MPNYDLEKLDDYRWRVPKQGGMQVPARLYATEEMLEDILSDDAPQQAVNVAHMPGIVEASMACWGASSERMSSSISSVAYRRAGTCMRPCFGTRQR